MDWHNLVINAGLSTPPPPFRPVSDQKRALLPSISFSLRKQDPLLVTHSPSGGDRHALVTSLPALPVTLSGVKPKGPTQT